MNLIELKWDGFLTHLHSNSNGVRREREGEDTHIRPWEGDTKCEKKGGKDEGDALNL